MSAVPHPESDADAMGIRIVLCKVKIGCWDYVVLFGMKWRA